jgi:5'-3' exonuclease
LKTLIFDGNNALWRLQKRLPTLTADGKAIQVVYGFMRLLRGALAQFEPNIALVCWDSGHSKFRKEIFEEYKANRSHTRTSKEESEFKDAMKQMKVVKKILPTINVVQIAFPDTEADDLIGISCHELKGEKIIVSSDQDMLHLVKDDVSVWSPIKSLLYDSRNFRKLTGMSPRQWLEYRALVGDSGDNIPGVAKGFGSETAKDLIERYGSIEKLYSPKVEKRVSKMGNRYSLLYSDGAREAASRNLKLMDLELPAEREDYPKISKMLKKRMDRREKVDRISLRKMFEERKFKSLLQDFARWVRPFEDLDYLNLKED